jgi:hypothetical protein
MTLVEAQIASEHIPYLSLQAWVKSLENLPGVETVSASPFEELENWCNPRLANLPNWRAMARQPDDGWVAVYQTKHESLACKQRQASQPQNGVFYTSAKVAGYLTQQTLGVYLNQMESQIERAWQKSHFDLALALFDRVRQTQIIDPSCGTGIFLVQALQCLHAFYLRLAQTCPELTLAEPAHSILTSQLSGIDLDPLSVLITECRLAQWVRRLDGHFSLSPETRLRFEVGDTLAGTRSPACGSEYAQPNVPLERWHFILGNPPFISEVRGQAGRFRKLKAENNLYYQAKMDLCDGFLAWSMDHLHHGGQLAYVLPAYWTQRSSTAPLRQRMWQEGRFRELWNFEGTPLFKNAPGHHSALLLWQKQQAEHFAGLEIFESKPGDSQIQHLPIGFGKGEDDLQTDNLCPGSVMLAPITHKLLLGEVLEVTLLHRLGTLPILLQSQSIQQGIVIPQGRLKSGDKKRLPPAIQECLPVQPGVFILTDEEVEALQFSSEERALLRPYYQPIGFQAFTGFPDSRSSQWIIYTDAANRQLLEQQPERYARLRNHLDHFASVNTSAFAPYGLHRSRQAIWFEDTNRILVPRQVFKPSFAHVPFPAYVNEGFLVIRAEENSAWLCALLNSDLAWFWFYHQKRKGSRLQIDKEVLLHFPQPTACSAELKDKIVELALQLSQAQGMHAELHSSSDWQSNRNALNELINQAYQLTSSEINCVARLKSQVFAQAGKVG